MEKKDRRNLLNRIYKLYAGKKAGDKRKALELIKQAAEERAALQDEMKGLVRPEAIGEPVNPLQHQVFDALNDAFEEDGLEELNSQAESPQQAASAEPAPPATNAQAETPPPGGLEEDAIGHPKPVNSDNNPSEAPVEEEPEFGSPGGVNNGENGESPNAPTGPEDTAGSDTANGTDEDGGAGEDTGAEGEGKEPKKPSAVDQAKDAAAQAVKDKTKKEVEKKTASAFWKVILPYLPWILLALVVILAIVFLVVFLMEKKKSGKDDLAPINFIEDENILAVFAKKSGNTEIADEISVEIKTRLEVDLTNLKETVADQALDDRIDALILKVQNLNGRNPSVVTVVADEIKAVMLALADLQAPFMTEPGSPILASISGYSEESHFGTPLRKDLPTAQSPGHGTYVRYGDGTADAVDLYTEAKAEVKAPFAGKIVDISDDGTGNKKIVLNQGDYELLIAFIEIEPSLQAGQNINKGAKLGMTAAISGSNLIHVELSCCGKSVVNMEIDKILSEKEGKPIGQYLWERMKKIMNIP